MASMPALVRRVISAMVMPPASSASPSGTACATSWMTTTGTTGHLVSSDCALIGLFLGWIWSMAGERVPRLWFGDHFRGWSSDDLAGGDRVIEFVPGGQALPVTGLLADRSAE